MKWKNRSRYSKAIAVLSILLIILNIILAIILPLLVLSNEKLVRILYLIQMAGLLPITSFVLLLLMIDFLKRMQKKK
ncbi:MAG: hypothetical protein PHH00_00140 [Candidatus Nanoarchaeia archaeon]|nr:hypothetical protein [Candidatus Nanoarchaeia archaeon]